MWSLLRGKATGAGKLKRRVKGGTKHLASPTFAPPTRSEDQEPTRGGDVNAGFSNRLLLRAPP